MVTEKKEVDCNKCWNIFITESQQEVYRKDTGKELRHRCVKHSRELFHRNEHPRIVPCFGCDGMDFVKGKI